MWPPPTQRQELFQPHRPPLISSEHSRALPRSIRSVVAVLLCATATRLYVGLRISQRNGGASRGAARTLPLLHCTPSRPALQHGPLTPASENHGKHKCWMACLLFIMHISYNNALLLCMSIQHLLPHYIHMLVYIHMLNSSAYCIHLPCWSYFTAYISYAHLTISLIICVLVFQTRVGYT